MKLPLVILTVVTLMHCGSLSGAVRIYQVIRSICYDALCKDYTGSLSCYSDKLTEFWTHMLCKDLGKHKHTSQCSFEFFQKLGCYCGKTSFNCYQTTTTSAPTTTVDPYNGFPTGDFMIKHEESGLCVYNFVDLWINLKKCDSTNRLQIWFNDGNYIKSRQYPRTGLYMDDYNLQRSKIGSAAIGYVRIDPPFRNRDQPYQWEYKNKFLTVNLPYSPRLMSVSYGKETLVSAAGAVSRPLGGKSMEAATAEDQRRMKWLLIPV